MEIVLTHTVLNLHWQRESDFPPCRTCIKKSVSTNVYTEGFNEGVCKTSEQVSYCFYYKEVRFAIRF